MDIIRNAVQKEKKFFGKGNKGGVRLTLLIS